MTPNTSTRCRILRAMDLQRVNRQVIAKLPANESHFSFQTRVPQGARKIFPLGFYVHMLAAEANLMGRYSAHIRRTPFCSPPFRSPVGPSGAIANGSTIFFHFGLIPSSPVK